MFDLAPNIAAETFSLRFQGDPFVPSARRVEIPVGLTVAQALEVAGVDAPEMVAVGIGGHAIPDTLRACVRPKTGALVEVRAVPGISGAITALASVFGTGTALAVATVGGLLASAALTYGAAVAVNSLYSTPSFSSADFSRRDPDTPRRYGITAARNEVRQWAPIPCVLGTHRFVPPYGASPYTELVGDDQYLRFVVLWGYGPVDLSDIRIGNSPLSAFEDVEVEHDLTGTQGSLTLYPDTANQENLSIALADTFSTRETPIETDEIGVTVTFPSGLFQLNSSGNRTSYSVTVDLEYRQVGAGAWTSWVSETITRAENAAVRQSWRVSGLTRAKYEVRVKRGDVPSTSSQVADVAVWSSLRSFRNEDPIQIAGIAKSAFRIRASDQLNGVVDELNAVVSHKIPTWNGTTWAGENVTTNPAAIYRYILTGTANKRALGTARIDDAKLGYWYDACDTAGYAYSKPIEAQVPVNDLLREVAAAGFASPHRSNDTQSVVLEEPKTTIVQHFTPRNTSGFRAEIATADQPHALRVQFPNADRDYRDDERIVYDDGYSAANATEFEAVSVPGVTDAANAYRHGRHIMAVGRLRPEKFTFNVDIENLVAERGDLVRLSHDVALIGQTAGRVKSVSGTDLTLDEPVVFETGKTYAIRVRGSDGSSQFRTATAAVGTQYTVSVASAAGIAAGDLFLFGETGAESIEALISEIELADDLAAQVTCIPYNAAVYTASDVIPPYTSVLSDPVSLSMAGPSSPVIANIVSDESALTTTSTGDLQPAMIVYFEPGAGAVSNPFETPVSSYRLRWRKTGSGDAYQYATLLADARQTTISGVQPGTAYEVGLQAVDAFGGVSAWATVASHTVIGFATPPPAVDTFQITTIGDQTYVEWTYPSIAPDVVSFEIRYHPATDQTAWAYMTTLSAAIPRTARQFTVPQRTGSYAIKAVDVAGNKSMTALYVNASSVADNGQTNVVSIAEHPAFSGAKTDVAPVGGKLQLIDDSVMADWGTLASVGSMSIPGAESGFKLSGTYEFGETDLGGVYTTRATASIELSSINFRNNMASWVTLASVATLAGGETGDEYSVTVQISYSTVDSATPVYGAWQNLVVGDFTARHVRFRLLLNTTDKKITPAVSGLTVTLDMPPRNEGGDDIVSGAGTKSITFASAFNTLTGVAITGQDLQTGDYWVVENKTASGFDVTFRNSAGAAVSRTFDWQAYGYGGLAA